MKTIILLMRYFLLLSFSIIFFSISAQTSEPILRVNTQIYGGIVHKISPDANGQYLLTVSFDKTAKLWDAANGTLLKTFRPAI